MKTRGLSFVLLAGIFLFEGTSGTALQAAEIESAEEIEEAQGLSENHSFSDMGSLPTSQKYRSRSYFWLEATQSWKRGSENSDRSEIPNAEYGSTNIYNISSAISMFVDFNLIHSANDGRAHSELNQLGLRLGLSENFAMALGKERNRRSPGMIVSPSDFIYSANVLPGQKEDRGGVWLSRASLVGPWGSLDFIFLPCDAVDSGGWPASESRTNGVAIRGSHQMTDLDLSVLAGRVEDTQKIGVSAQTIVLKVWKTYYEFGYSEEVTTLLRKKKSGRTQSLVGLSYEGSDDFGVRLEYFWNGYGIEPDEVELMRNSVSDFLRRNSVSSANPFFRKQYLVASANLAEVRNRFNFIWSGIRSLEDNSMVSILRSEALINDRLVAGLVWQKFADVQSGQYSLRPFDEALSVDLKYSF